MWTQTVLRLIAMAFVGGLLCGACWDLFKIQRIVFGISETCYENKLKYIIVFVQDVLFCLACGILAILVFYYGNEGNVRVVGLLVMSLGFVIYRTTIGHVVTKCTERALKLFKSIFKRGVDLVKKIKRPHIKNQKKAKFD